MKPQKALLTLFCLALFASCDKGGTDPVSPAPEVWVNTGKYEMSNGVISKECLYNYLSRAITESVYLFSEKYKVDNIWGTEDDTRMLKNIGAKFIGRAVYHWGNDKCLNDSARWQVVKDKIDAYHQYDPSVIFQGAIFEIVDETVNNVAIPAWVFEAFGKPVETRNFVYKNIMSNNKKDLWGSGKSVPDISKEEAQMYFYFQAVKYMELGIEALHFGQVELMAEDKDAANNYAGWKKVTNLVHKAALTKARRGTVLLDGHLTSGGIIVDGESLFDFVSYPLRPRENSSEDASILPANVKKGYLTCMIGRTKGGMTPSGWQADRLPYLLEFDNFGTSDHPGKMNLADIYVWGYDEISWFANVSKPYAKQWLGTTIDYINQTDPGYGFLQMPGLRVAVGKILSDQDKKKIYRCNTYDKDICPEGGDIENTIKALWQ